MNFETLLSILLPASEKKKHLKYSSLKIYSFYFPRQLLSPTKNLILSFAFLCIAESICVCIPICLYVFEFERALFSVFNACTAQRREFLGLVGNLGTEPKIHKRLFL